MYLPNYVKPHIKITIAVVHHMNDNIGRIGFNWRPRAVIDVLGHFLEWLNGNCYM